jgi:antibiotic biosynthesis monooxygenase (ABM) superfamily enzyme
MRAHSADGRHSPVPPPSKHQLALMIWLAVLPTLAVLNLALSSLLEDTPFVLRTVIVVPIVMYSLMPIVHRLRSRALAR